MTPDNIAGHILEHFQVIYDRLVRSEILIETTHSDDAPWLCDRFPFESDLAEVRTAVGEFVNHLGRLLHQDTNCTHEDDDCTCQLFTTCHRCDELNVPIDEEGFAPDFCTTCDPSGEEVAT